MALIPPVVEVESHLAPTPQAYNSVEIDLGVAIEHPDVVLDLAEDAEVIPPARIPVQPEWTQPTERVFNQLVEKEALGTATREELAELDSLSNLRRQTEMPRTGADIVREYEQGQLIRDLLHSLTRYVEFEQNSAKPNSTRPRPKAKA